MTHNIIKTENYLLVVDDSEIKAVDWFINLISKELLKCFKNSAVKSLGGKTINMTEKWLNNNDCKKIIAHLPLNNSPVLEGVDLLPPLEDDVEVLAEKYVDSRFNINPDTIFTFERLHRETFIEGYNKAKEKYNKNLIDWIDNISNSIFAFQASEIELKMLEQFKNKVQSLQQPKMPVGFECEVERIYPNPQTISKEYDFDDILIERKTTTNSQGQTVLVGKYIY